MPLSRATARSLCAANTQAGLRETEPRLDVQIDQAMNRLVRHRNAFVRREEFDFPPITFIPGSDPLQLDAPDSLKMMVLVLWREENNALELAGTLEARAYGLLEQDIVQATEAANKDAYRSKLIIGTPYSRAWYAARLGLDTAGGLVTSNLKLLRYVRRAADWIYQKRYEYQLVERNRVHAGAPALAAQPALDTDVFSPAIDYEQIRLVCQAFALEGSAQAGDAQPQNLSAQFLAEAAGLIVRRLEAELEALRHGAYTAALDAAAPYTGQWYTAKLGLELADGLRLSKVELWRLVYRAAQWIYQKVFEYQLIERNRIHTGPPALAVAPLVESYAFNPRIDYETLRLVAQAFRLEDSSDAKDQSPMQRSGQMLGEASALIARRLDAELESLRHGLYTTTLDALTADTFGATKAQLALELPVGLKLSTAEIGRLVNSAERRLVECGKWKNAIADYEVRVTVDGEVDMPPEVEVVMGAIICGAPALIRGRWYEVTEGGPGAVGDGWRCNGGGILVDRGEVVATNANTLPILLISEQYFHGLLSEDSYSLASGSWYTTNGLRCRRYWVGAKGSTATPFIAPGANTVTNPFEAEVTLADSGLYTGNAATGFLAGTDASADFIAFGGQTYFYETGNGWRKYGGGAADQSAVVVPRGTQVTINRNQFAGPSYGFIWNTAASSAFVQGSTLKVRAKRRFQQRASDADEMMIRNFSALKAAATCLIHEGFAGPEQRDPKLAAFYWTQAIGILSAEVTEHHSGEQHSMPVQTEATLLDIPFLQ